MTKTTRGPKTAEMGGYAFASEVTGIGVNTLYSLVHSKRVPHIKLNRRLIRFNKTDLEEWLNSQKVEVVRKRNRPAKLGKSKRGKSDV